MISPLRHNTSRRTYTSQGDPLERWIPLGLKIFVYFLLLVYLIQAAEAFYEYVPGRSWPFLLAAIRNGIFLFIHEGGHALFMFFGRTLNILGGSFWQIMFPLLSFVIALRNRSHFIAPFALFWVGTNMMDVSLYMRDAPVRMLPLLGGHKVGHDWWNLFRQWEMLDSAGAWADFFYFTGLLISIAALAGGVYLAVQRFLNPIPFRIPDDEDRTPMIRKMEDLRRTASDTSTRATDENKGNTFEGL